MLARRVKPAAWACAGGRTAAVLLAATVGSLQDAAAQSLPPLLPELPRYGAWALAASLGAVAIFFLLRGRVAIERGWSGLSIVRFGRFQRLVHWLLAISFLVLALTGLGRMYAGAVLLPLAGAETLAAVSGPARQLHAYAAYGFMLGLALALLAWVRHSLPGWRDAVWLATGGGLLVKGWHPPAWKFNAGQKALFWLVLLLGSAASASGLALMFPYQTALVSKTFAMLNAAGAGLPANLTPSQELQYAAMWHGLAALALTCVVIVHVYLRTIGIQGAASAMGSGRVDLNWAEQHHSLWAERELERMEAEEQVAGGGARMAPAE